MTKITKDNYTDTAIGRLESMIRYEEMQIEQKQKLRTLPNNKYKFMPKKRFDSQIHLHKENIRVLKFAINNIKRNKKWEELTPEEKSKACTVNVEHDSKWAVWVAKQINKSLKEE